MVSINSNWDSLCGAIPENACYNSPFENMLRNGIRLNTEKTFTGNNSTYNINVAQVTGSIRILEYYYLITDTTAMTNMTSVYSDLYDGTIADDITASGVNLSGLSVGTALMRLKLSINQFTVADNSQGRVTEDENLTSKFMGMPFVITQKNGVNTYIRFNYTTNTTLNMKAQLNIIYQPLNGGTLALV